MRCSELQYLSRIKTSESDLMDRRVLMKYYTRTWIRDKGSWSVSFKSLRKRGVSFPAKEVWQLLVRVSYLWMIMI